MLDGIGLGNGTLFCLRTANQQNPQSRCLNPKLSAMIEVLRGIEVFVARIPDRKDANAVLCIPARRANEEKGRTLFEEMVSFRREPHGRCVKVA